MIESKLPGLPVVPNAQIDRHLLDCDSDKRARLGNFCSVLVDNKHVDAHLFNSHAKVGDVGVRDERREQFLCMGSSLS